MTENERKTDCMKKILLTSRFPREGLGELFERYDVYYPEKEDLSYEEIYDMIEDYDALMISNRRVDEKMLDKAANLEIISNYSVGYDRIDVKYATEKRITVTNTPRAVTEPTAEIAYGLMLCTVRNIAYWDRKIKNGYDRVLLRMTDLEHSLYGRNLGIIGMGRIGRAVAGRAAAGGMKIFYHNRNRLPEKTEKSLGAVYLSMDELLETADVISVHTPLSQETYHLIGEDEFRKMKPSVYIINTARGAVVDENALIRHLQSGKVAGAGLDVFQDEPDINSRLAEMEQVVLTPHIGTDTFEANKDMAEEASLNIVEYFKGNVPVNTVNPEVIRKQDI